MEQLARNRPVFHSEADFQHALAMQMATHYPDVAIRLEYRPLPDRPVYTDIWVSTAQGNVAIELKYKTRRAAVDLAGERFQLANHGAQDIGMHDFWKDVQRVEEVCAARETTEGAVIFLSNDPTYWRASKRTGTCAEAFRLHEARLARGELRWASHTGAGTMKSREAGVDLGHSYRVSWANYGTVSAAGGLEFRYALLTVPGSVS